MPVAGSARTRSIGVTLIGLLLVPLVALVALWGFLASITLGNALTEHNDNRIAISATRSSSALLAALEKERLATFLWLSSPRRPPVSELAASRRADDAAIASYESGSAQGLLARQELIAQLRKIPGIRDGVDSGALSAPAAFAAYGNIVDGLFAAYAAAPESDVSLYQQTLAAIAAGRALEQVTRELALVAGAEVDRGQMSAADRVLFTEAAGDRALLTGDALTLSSGQMRASLRRLYSSSLYGRLVALEGQIAASAHGQALPQGVLRAWGPVSTAFVRQALAVTNADSKPLAAEEGQASGELFLEAGLAGGLGLLAVLGSLFLMVRFGRSIRRDLTGLHDGAAAMAGERLPRVIERLRRGDEVDVAAESPPLATGKITEVARVANAFSAVQHTAVDAAVGQANLRKGVSQVFLNLSLRNQSLLHRQLGILDTMERATEDPAGLADLFRLDHLTTRMRRHAESLIILSGATPGRGWRDPVPVLDVLSAAIAEVEDYVRVDVNSESPDSVTGAAANDVVHLLAELVENATSFSPPNSRVEIRADAVGIGVAVEIEDRGLGLTPAELTEINARLASPPEFDLAHSDQLGLFVVGQLATRHGIRVSLRESPYGGATAIVLLPRSIIVRKEETGPPALPGRAGYVPARVNGVPRSPGIAAPVPDQAPPAGVTGRHRFRGVPQGQASRPDARPEPRQQASPWKTPPRMTQETATAQTAPIPGGWLARGGQDHGLPRRVRQANLAPQLRNRGAGAADAAEPASEPVARSPEEMRSMMSSLQDAWQRGRVDDLDSLADEPDDRPGRAPDVRDGNDREA
jgi:signal transduction histidine kinase